MFKAILLSLCLIFTASCVVLKLNGKTQEGKFVSSLVDKTVRVEIYCDEELQGWGSGVLANSKLVLTAEHVTDGTCDKGVRKIFTIYKDKKIPASIKSTDRDNDVALLSLDEYVDVPALGIETNPYLGQTITCVGYPSEYANNGDYQLTVSRGSLMQLYTGQGKFHRFDAVVYFGNSGSPCFNMDGELVGIVVRLYASFNIPLDGAYYMTPASRVFSLF
jgi:S1-C subfamily serine protease